MRTSDPHPGQLDQDFQSISEWDRVSCMSVSEVLPRKSGIVWRRNRKSASFTRRSVPSYRSSPVRRDVSLKRPHAANEKIWGTLPGL